LDPIWPELGQWPGIRNLVVEAYRRVAERAIFSDVTVVSVVSGRGTGTCCGYSVVTSSI